MAITIGLDFGTHQTKICIENSDSPLHKTYEFYEWEKGVYAFPSIIQINKDHTLRYGSVDMESCLVAKKRKYHEHPGDMIFPPKPDVYAPDEIAIPNLPPVPVVELYSEEDKSKIVPYNELYGIGKQLPINKEYNNAIRKWKKKCQKIEFSYKKRLSEWRRYGNKLGVSQPTEPIYPQKPQLSEFENAEEFNPLLIATDNQKSEYLNWNKKCKTLMSEYNEEVKRRFQLISENKIRISEWNSKCENIRRNHLSLLKIHEESIIEYPMIFRYFKQATFSAYPWEYEIQARDLSVLYLAYIIFRLEERFGTDFSIQMGIPASKENFERMKSFATGCLIQAIRLVEDVFQNNYEKFLQTPYEELLVAIPKYEFSIDLKTQYGLIILPEAYAALRSLTANSRIPRGMNIILDMGGGTTDISFFVIEENGEPHIYHFESISKGLNFFLEYEDRHKFRAIDFSTKRELEDIPKKVFDNAYQEFKGHIDNIIKSLTNFLHQDTISRGFQKSAFRDAVQNRPAIYTGGGCYDIRMRRPILDFSDVKYIDKKILGIKNVIDEKRINIPYSLMATAFGLSIQRLDDEIDVSRKEELFAKYSNIDERQERWNTHREHGMYED